MLMTEHCHLKLWACRQIASKTQTRKSTSPDGSSVHLDRPPHRAVHTPPSHRLLGPVLVVVQCNFLDAMSVFLFRYSRHLVLIHVLGQVSARGSPTGPRIPSVWNAAKPQRRWHSHSSFAPLPLQILGRIKLALLPPCTPCFSRSSPPRF
jgi:hypothetical protein